MAFVISHKYRFVFVHIPKTGGTSICTVPIEDHYGFGPGYLNDKLDTDDLRLPHQHILHAKTILGENDFEDYYKFCIIRNPYERAVSMFKGHQEKWKTFDNFVNHIKTADIFTRSMIYWPQKYWITDPYVQNVILTDEMLRFDHLIMDLKSALTRCGVKCNGTFPRYRNSEVNNYDAFYNLELRSIIKDIYAKDFELI